MSNKVTNIYIDTTGFCDEAKERVNKALDIIVEYNEMENIYPSRVAEFKSHLVTHFDHNGIWCRTFNASPSLDGKRSVGLWELESIAFRCKQAKKEESLPTRNIYIDARQLDFDDRLSAFNKINSISNDSHVAGGWLPDEMALNGRNVDAFVLCDIFEIDSNGDSAFYLRKGDMDEFYRENRNLELPAELTLKQLMGLTR